MTMTTTDTMCDTQRGLLDAILENPDDDARRFVYSDWLEENDGYYTCKGCGGIGEIDDDVRYGPSFPCTRCGAKGRIANGFARYASFIRVQLKISELFNDETDWSQCEGISASWCPNCGDCCCKDREESMNDLECPLHSPYSNHASFEILGMKERSLWGS
jgi:uncharacterized protein (TIGR02996 family)